MPLTVWSSARYTFPLPDGHRFPIAKYALLREAVIRDGLVPAERVVDPAGATDEVLGLVHTPAYLRRFVSGEMDAAELRQLGFPWSAALVERSRRAVGGTIAAARHALAHGIGMNLAGGTHHAFADHGEGFCVFNDVAVAIRLLQHEGLIRRAAVVDLDVHQGNGTHAIFAEDADVYTFSMHGEGNYPFRRLSVRPGHANTNEVVDTYGLRVPGNLDIDLEDGTGDSAYLEKLRTALPQVLRESQPDIVFYLAGADPHEGDLLGKLALTVEGLRARDSFVIGMCWEIGLPVAIAIAGGYGRRIENTLQVHLNTVRIAVAFAT